MNRIYRGFCHANGDCEVVVEADAMIRRLEPRLDLANHSPSGFAWGYGGSGPAQLALAILADALDDDERALRLHQRFKWRVTARLEQGEPWSLTSDAVLATIKEIEAEANN